MNEEYRSLLHPRSTPLAATDIAVPWLHQVRSIIVRDGLKVRPGFPACIEIQRAADRVWMPLNLPNNGIEFVGKRDRDTVLAWLNGDKELPVIPVVP